jgi:hypothetical protein
MYKLKIPKGVTLILKSRGITIDGNKDYNQITLESWYNIGLTQFVSKSKPKKDGGGIDI